MYGMGNSLNVAMAYGILVYELIHCCLGVKRGSPEEATTRRS
jgi:hypothetical protein